MTLFKSIILGTTLWTFSLVSAWADESTDRPLTEREIQNILAQSGLSETSPDVVYLDGSETVEASVACCEILEEEVETRLQVEEVVETIDVVTQRDIIQPVERTEIQPIIRERLEGRVEEIARPRIYETRRLAPKTIRDDVPELVENIIPKVSVETREDVTETIYDVVTQRDIIQPIERTTVIPVQRRILRPVTETVVNETRYETFVAPEQRESIELPETVETVREEINVRRETEYTDKPVPYVAERKIYQPKTITTIQPVIHQKLRGRTESQSAMPLYEEERLPTRVESEPTPQLVERVQTEIRERTVLEVEDIYVDQVTRTVIQPIVVTTVQPVIKSVLRGRTEVETRMPRHETEILPTKFESVSIPETVETLIPQITELMQEEHSETYFDALTQRDIYQPILRTLIQPVEVRKVNPVSETVTNPTQYETVRVGLVVLTVEAPCACD